MKVSILFLVIASFLSGCTWGSKVSTGGIYQAVPVHTVDILERPPQLDYKIIGMVSVRGGANFLVPDARVIRKLQKAAADLGADAVIIDMSADGFYNTGEGRAIKYQ